MRTRTKGIDEFSEADLIEDSARGSAVHPFPAALIKDRAVGLSISDDQLMMLARDRAPDPAVFEEADSKPYFFFAEISNNRTDSYHSRMMPSSLRNYATGCDDGVAFLECHNRWELPLGGSLKGRFVAPGGDGIAHVFAAFFTVPSLQQGGLDSSQLIRGIRTGITKDVSIGFYGGRSVCSICGGDMWDYRECPHYPGVEYDIADQTTGAVKERRIAEELIEDATLSEVSAVSDGACPGAAIQKSLRALMAGQLDEKSVRTLEARYRIKLPNERKIFSGNTGEANMNKTKCTACNEEFEQGQDARHAETEVHKNAVAEATRVAEAETARKAEEEAQRIADAEKVRKAAEDATRSAGEKLGKDTITKDERDAAVAEFERIKAENTRLNTENQALKTENARLAPLADDGTAYRTSLIEHVLNEGKRTQGKNFREESWRATLANPALTLDQIRDIGVGFGAKGDEIFKGGRSTTDTVEDPPAESAPARRLNDRAFGG